REGHFEFHLLRPRGPYRVQFARLEGRIEFHKIEAVGVMSFTQLRREARAGYSVHAILSTR
ncbi:hypothetical protein HAX54_030452, partial [Datura stramonium]|nr:hypothetical protein [Datura stramonium]